MLAAALLATYLGSGPVIVENGRSEWGIGVGPNSGPALEHGAGELRAAIEEMSGVSLPILHEKRPGAKQIWIEFDKRAPVEGYSIDVAADRVTIRGGERGAMYGCYALLEDQLGCRWFNSRVSYVPKQATIQLPLMHLKEKPAFEYREPFYAEAFGKEWASRNRVNGASMQLDDSVGGRVKYGKFVHTFSEIAPPNEYFAKHPEWFSLVDGKRRDDYAQLCLTNPELLKHAIEVVKGWIKADPKATIFSVSQNDTYENCQCDNCKAVEKEEGAPSGVLLRFVNAVADAIRPEYPNVLIDTLAYQWTEKPPLHVRPHKNVRVRLAPIGACVAHAIDSCDANKSVFDNLKAWSRITNQLYIWHYSTNFANYLQPIPDLDEIAQDIRLFHKTGVVGLFYEGDYAAGGGGEMSELKAYLMAKLMWNPERPAQPIIDDYVRHVYGSGATYVSQWLNLLHGPERNSNVHAHIYDPSNSPYLSEQIVSKGQNLFDSAMQATESEPLAHEEVRKARLAVDYVYVMNMKAGAERVLLASALVSEIEHFGINQTSEGGSTADFKKRILGSDK